MDYFHRKQCELKLHGKGGVGCSCCSLNIKSPEKRRIRRLTRRLLKLNLKVRLTK